MAWVIEYMLQGLTEIGEKVRIVVRVVFAFIGITMQQLIDIKFPFQIVFNCRGSLSTVVG